MSEIRGNFFSNYVEHTNMQQKYVEIGRDCIFTYFWHHTFRPNNSNGNGKTLVL